jgi:hypothetical protein
MKEFPKNLSVKYKQRFPEIYYMRMKCYLRKELYEHIISREEKDYFSLDEFNSRFRVSMEITQKIIREVIPELETLGWTCKLSFGDTGLFIYSDKKPENCWEQD